jgi:hypothetical protein
MSRLPRSGFAALFAASLLFGSLPALAQGGDAKPGEKPGDKPAQAQVDADAQRRVDEFAEAARQVSGPAGNAECVWLGRRVVGLLWRDDMDTAFRHLDLYDRFGCPGPHIQSSFRCVVRQGAGIDQKNPQSLNQRVHACWLNPSSGTATAAAPAPASTAAGQPAAPATQGAAQGAQGAAAPPASAQAPAASRPQGTSSR